jgi:hypothetical protein
MTLDEWLNEIEVFSSRWERLEEDVNYHNTALRNIYAWLEAAYAVGHNAGLSLRGDKDKE